MTWVAAREPRTSRSSESGTVYGGAAGLAVRSLVDGPRRRGHVIAVFPVAVYLEVSGVSEPRVVALVTSEAVRLPNAVVLTRTGPSPFAAVRPGDEAVVGEGGVTTGPLRVRVRRWWDPSPVLGPISRARLHHGAARLRRACDAAPRRPGLAGHDVPDKLAASCAAGDLATAVEAAEQLVGLGPGLTPSGDDILAGLLLALRLLGGAVPGGTVAVWLADWLGAAVTAHADRRTTSLAATLLHCAAHGQAAGEVAAVLRGIAGQEPFDPAIRRLLAAGHTSGVDLAWGLLAGCRSALRLTEPRGGAATPPGPVPKETA